MIKRDKMHWNPCRMDSYNKPFNFCISARSSGKTTAMLLKIYKKWKHTKRPSIILRRMTVDITDAYITDIQDTINDFIPDDEQLIFKYKKGSIKDGIVDVYVDDSMFLRFISLSVPKSRIKSLHMEDPYLILYDEFIVDMANNEKYSTDEAGKFKDLYETFARFAMRNNHTLKLYAMGNPYSAYSPLLVWLDVPLEQLIPGTFLVGPNYTVDVYKLKPELVEWIKKRDPLAVMEDDFAKFAFQGINVNDRNIVVVPKQPEGYGLRFVIYIQQKVLKIYWRKMNRPFGTDFGKFWVEDCNKYEGSKTAYAIDFNNLSEGSVLINVQDKMLFYRLKEAIARRDVTYSSISAFYLLTGCYNQL